MNRLKPVQEYFSPGNAILEPVAGNIRSAPGVVVVFRVDLVNAFKDFFWVSEHINNIYEHVCIYGDDSEACTMQIFFTARSHHCFSLIAPGSATNTYVYVSMSYARLKSSVV